MFHATVSALAQIGALLALVSPAAPAAPAAPAPAAAAASVAGRYVALGDSYSAGTGTNAYRADPSCQRSRYAYPALVAKRRASLRLVFVACAGATTDDVLLDQVSRVDEQTRLVTITIGGNDVGFADVLSTCAGGGGASCSAAIDRALGEIRDALPAKLDAVYAQIARRAPAAKVIVLGYPRLFSGSACQPIAAALVSRLNRGANLLRDTIRRRVAAAGGRFSFRDAIGAFEGHGICGRRPWINGLVSPITDSYHPNRAGHGRGYAPLVLRAIE